MKAYDLAALLWQIEAEESTETTPVSFEDLPEWAQDRWMTRARKFLRAEGFLIDYKIVTEYRMKSGSPLTWLPGPKTVAALASIGDSVQQRTVRVEVLEDWRDVDDD